MKLMVVDDDRDLVELLDYALRREGYEVVRAYDGEAALETLNREHPDLVVLDINLPKLAGFVVLERIRHVDEHVAVLLLSARQDESDILRGLQLGADDYITKPFSPRELTARINALLRRKLPEHGQSMMTAGAVQLDPISCSVSLNQAKIEIGHAEFKLLKFFLAHPDRVFSRSQLLDKVWGDHVMIEERTVDVHVLRLRKALKEAEHLIKTVRSVGYMLSEK